MITFKSLNFNIDDTFNYNNLIKKHEEYIDNLAFCDEMKLAGWNKYRYFKEKTYEHYLYKKDGNLKKYGYILDNRSDWGREFSAKEEIEDNLKAKEEYRNIIADMENIYNPYSDDSKYTLIDRTMAINRANLIYSKINGLMKKFFQKNVITKMVYFHFLEKTLETLLDVDYYLEIEQDGEYRDYDEIENALMKYSEKLCSIAVKYFESVFENIEPFKKAN